MNNFRVVEFHRGNMQIIMVFTLVWVKHTIIMVLREELISNIITTIVVKRTQKCQIVAT